MPHKSETTVPRPEEEGEFDLEKWIQTELFRQYEEQVEMLNELGILDHFPQEDKMGVLGIDGEKYYLPSKEAIAAEILKDPERYQTKIEQGFTVLNLVPFAKPLEQLIQVMKEQLLQHHEDGELLDTSGEPLDLDLDAPFWCLEEFNGADVSGGLVYYPEQFDQQNHQGKTKQQILDQTRNTPFAGWNIQLLEDLPDLPREGKGKRINGRKQIEACKTPIEYLKILKELHEQGMIPEDWIVYFINHLKQTNQVIDDYEGKGSSCWLAGAFSSVSGSVPLFSWSQDDRQFVLGVGAPSDSRDSIGLRPAVRIGELNLAE